MLPQSSSGCAGQLVPWQNRPVKPGSHSHLQEETFRRPCCPQLIRQGLSGTSGNTSARWSTHMRVFCSMYSARTCCLPAHRTGQQRGPTAESNQTWKKCRESSKAPPYRAPPADLSPPSYPCSTQTQQGKRSRTTGVIYLGSTGHFSDKGDFVCIYFKRCVDLL